MTIDSLIKKYQEEIKTCDEQINQWQSDWKKTNDGNYKSYCKDVVTEVKGMKCVYLAVIQDLKQIKANDQHE